MLLRFEVTMARLIWSITSLLFAVKGQKTAKAWLFLRRLDLQKAGVSAAESSSLAVFSLQITAKTATTLKVSQWAPPQAIAVNSMDNM
jgi:small-conductance mechanosensitive channel